MVETEKFTKPDAGIVDRRRPGRFDAATSLVTILRNPAGSGVIEDDIVGIGQAPEPSAPAQGIVLALTVCVPVWCTVGAVLYGVFG